jgi:hypothetical protein
MPATRQPVAGINYISNKEKKMKREDDFQERRKHIAPMKSFTPSFGKLLKK